MTTPIVDDVFHKAAKEVLKNLSGRSGIGNELEACDAEVLNEITATVADIIHKSVTDHIADNFFKDDESGDVKILSITDAKTELKELFARNMFKTAID